METNARAKARGRPCCQKLLVAIIALVAFPSVFAAEGSEPCAPVVAQIVSAQGSVEFRRRGQAGWQSASLDDALCAGDMVRVRERSRAGIALTNDIVLRLDQQTTLTLAGVEETKPTLLELCTGAIHFFTRYRKTFRLLTPFVNAAVEGTEVSVDRSDTQDNILVYEGQVFASNEPTRLLPETCGPLPEPKGPGGTLLLTANEAGVIPADQPPSKRPGVVVRPENAVQWALYYPPVIDYGIELAAPEARVRDSLKLYREGRLAEALSTVAPSAEDATVREPRFFNYRAGLLLSVGRVDEARLDIERALRLDPNNSAAHALQAIISVVQNQKERALNFANKAVQLDEKSAAARIALSYAQQANFQIEPALQTVKEAVALDPQNALAWARLAELELSTGNLDRALAAAERAASLNPNLARTQTVLGFAHLTRIDTRAAKTAFTRAIELDQADPLPRLGLGLAKIRESDLGEGRREIEIAASLDPANSLIRSYLGKAYYEEKREDLAGTQFDLAEALDPRDPTPWFYDAVRKQTLNRPVEALQDLEKSIERNDNRAVYRSSLLLDEDRATRGTSLARVYDDLGFDQLALVEASRSLSLDPASHSAHRFLSDSYARLPRHEIARVSELLQAQLLQPLNVNPVQPRLAVTDLNIVSGAGPAEAAFNEFTPLFERNRPQFTVSGLGGNNGSWGDEAVLSGLNGRMSYSLGQFHYETDGFRENNDLEHDIYNAFAQVAVTPKLNLQAELRRRETERGDIRMNFNPDNFSRSSRFKIRDENTRLGARLSPSPELDFIASLIYADRREEQEVFGATARNDVLDEEQGYQAEAQLIFRANRLNLTAGLGNYEIDVDQRILRTPPPSPLPSESTRRQDNAYAYGNITLRQGLIWTLGLSKDSFEAPGLDLDEVNPKLGLQWKMTDYLELRLAAFETIKRALIVDQTIEPTQVAGFNQFFDDINGTRAKRYGIGADARFTENLYGGIEASTRHLKVPNRIPLTVIVGMEDHEEDLYRAYLYWAPHRNWAVSAEYQFDQFSLRESTLGTLDPRPPRIETQSAPLAIRYFNPSGFFAEIGATHVRQSIDLRPTPTFSKDRDDFFLIDGAVGYRLPNRRGIISVEARNLFDEEFLFQDDSFRTSETRSARYIPDRTVFARITLSF